MSVEDRELLGPVEYVVVEFADQGVGERGLALLHGLVDDGTIAVLDIECVERTPDGVATKVTPDRIAGTGLTADDLAGADTRLLDDDDIAHVAAAIEPGSAAVIVVYEVLALDPVIAAWQAEGGTVVGAGPIAPSDLEDALDASDEVTHR